MRTQHSLKLEILSGPLDGAIVVLTHESAWGSAGTGPLVFPWDAELGHPQAWFLPTDGTWVLVGVTSQHGTYRINTEEPVNDGQQIKLAPGDILKASGTWLAVVEISGGAS